MQQYFHCTVVLKQDKDKELPRVDSAPNPVGEDKIKTLVTWWYKYIFITLYLNFMKTCIFLIGDPILRRKSRINGRI